MADHNHTKTAISGGNIRRCRVVYLSDEWTVLEMSTAQSWAPYGVAQEYSRKAPGTPFDTSLYAAANGDELLVYTIGGRALAECGGTVTGGNMVTVDSTARIVNSNFGAAQFSGGPVSTGWNIGLALESGTAGDVVRIDVNPTRGWA